MERLTGEVLDIHNAYSSYRDYKAALDGELQKSAESFVRIGYLLKVAVDTDILKESGYRSVYEFAKDEYNLDKSQVSRFIRINDEFSENGYSDKLQERYRSFGHAKLALMLLLPAEIKEELSAGYSKAEIQAVKEEVDEEKKISDLEVMMEEKDQGQQSLGIFGKVIHQIGRDDPELYLKLNAAVCDTAYDGTINPVVNKLVDALAPAGEAIITVRIAGEGRKMLSIKGADINPALVDVRSGKKTSCTWDQLINEIEVLSPDAGNAREAWEILYGEAFPEKKEKVAPVQPRKASRVTKAKSPEETRPDPAPQEQEKGPGQQKTEESRAGGQEEKDALEIGEENVQGEDSADDQADREPPADPESGHHEDGAGRGAGEDSSGGGADGENGPGAEAGQPEEAQIEGQLAITDYPECLPEETEKRTEAADMENPGPGITDADGMRQHIENQKDLILETLQTVKARCEKEDWDGMIQAAKDMITRAESIRNMEEMYRYE